MQSDLPTARHLGCRSLPGAVFLGLLIGLITSPLQAQDTQGINSPGLILLKTTGASFQVTVVRDFFGAGSDPQTVLQLSLKGKELRTSPAGLFGTEGTNGPPVDTVLELEYPYAAPGISEFRVVGLHLGNPYTQPVTVTYGGINPQLWDVEVCLSAVKQLGGLIELTRAPGGPIISCGGTFKYSLAVTPKVIFKRRGAPPTEKPKLMDPGTTAFITFLANGQWAIRGYNEPLSAFPLFEVANQFQDAYIDADCNGEFDSDPGGDCLTERLPTLASSDLVLGAGCSFNSLFPQHHDWTLQPYTQGPEQSQTVQAATP